MIEPDDLKKLIQEIAVNCFGENVKVPISELALVLQQNGINY